MGTERAGNTGTERAGTQRHTGPTFSPPRGTVTNGKVFYFSFCLDIYLSLANTRGGGVDPPGGFREISPPPPSEILCSPLLYIYVYIYISN